MVSPGERLTNNMRHSGGTLVLQRKVVLRILAASVMIAHHEVIGSDGWPTSSEVGDPNVAAIRVPHRVDSRPPRLKPWATLPPPKAMGHAACLNRWVIRTARR